MARRDYVGEIEEIRDRNGPPNWDGGLTRLLFLATSSANLKTEGEEIGYYPVAAIAALETYFRQEIRTLVDSGDVRFVNNVKLDELPLKVDHTLLFALHGRRITVGELVAHAVQLSSLEAINKTMSQLMGENFLALVKDARDPFERREKGDNAPAAIGSADGVIADVKRAFEVRNFICHEAHLRAPTTIEEVQQICPSCYTFARASRFAVKYHLNPRTYLTLEEASNAAADRVSHLNHMIESLEKEITSTMPPHELDAFRAMQDAWRVFVDRKAEFAASQQMNGNRGDLHQKLVTEEQFRERVLELTAWKKVVSGLNDPESKTTK